MKMLTSRFWLAGGALIGTVVLWRISVVRRYLKNQAFGADAQGPGASAASSAEPGTAAESAATATSMAVGSAVRLVGLKKAALNGSVGRVVGFDGSKGRLNVKLADGKTLQVKQVNLQPISSGEPDCPPSAVPSPSSSSPARSTAAELCRLTLADHESLKSVHAQRVIELLAAALQSPKSAEPTAVGFLFRCVCCIEWHVPLLRRCGGSGDEQLVTYETNDGGGVGFIVSTTAPYLTSVLRIAKTPPADMEHAARIMAGRDLFQSTSTEAANFVSLCVADDKPFAMLSKGHLPALDHMCSALNLEAELSTILSALDGEGSLTQAAAKRFNEHVFFCFNAASNAEPGRCAQANNSPDAVPTPHRCHADATHTCSSSAGPIGCCSDDLSLCCRPALAASSPSSSQRTASPS